MSKSPWMKWYPADWRADPRLRMCSLAARGLWADLLSLMHEAEPYGHLLINGIAPSGKQIASLLGGSEREIKALIAELESTGVFSRADGGVIYSRRMVRDKAKADKDRENGLDGGSPLFIRGTVPKEERVRRYRRSDSPVKTQRIFDRDGGKCHWCQTALLQEWHGSGEVPLNLFHVDHVIAVRDGGGNEEANLVASCRSCNGARAVHGVGVKVGNNSDHKAQILEARSKKDSDASASGGSSPPFDPVKDLWNRGIGILGEKHRSLLGKFVKGYGQIAVLAAIIECENEQPVDPAAYFIACLERGKINAGNGSAASGNAKLAAWARAEDEQESFRGYSEAAH